MYPNDEALLLSTVTLTAAYAGNTTAAQEFRSQNGLSFTVNYDRNAGSASAYLELQVDTSPNGTDWFPYGIWADSGAGVMLFTESTYKQLGDGKVPIYLDEVRGRYFRVRARETAVTTTNFGTVTVYAYKNEI